MNIHHSVPVTVYPIVTFIQEEINETPETFARFFSDDLLRGSDFIGYLNRKHSVTPEANEDFAREILERKGVYSEKRTWLNKVGTHIDWCNGFKEPLSCEDRLLRHVFRVTVLKKERATINALSVEVLAPLEEPTALEKTVEKIKALWNSSEFKIGFGACLLLAQPTLALGFTKRVTPILTTVANTYLSARTLSVLDTVLYYPKTCLFFTAVAAMFMPQKSLITRTIQVVGQVVIFCRNLSSDRMKFFIILSQQLSGNSEMRDDRDQELEDFFVDQIINNK